MSTFCRPADLHHLLVSPGGRCAPHIPPFPPFAVSFAPHSLPLNPPPLCPLQRFTFKPVDAQKQGETHPTVIPIAPKHGMRMYVS